MFGTLEPLKGGDEIPLLKEELIVGRSESCDIVLRFSNVSSKHCRLVLAHGYWYAVDMGSSNGTTVDGVRVRDRRVDPGARISFAKHDYALEYDPVANGANPGETPSDYLESNVLGSSLLERAGIAKGPSRPLPKKPEARKATLEDLESGRAGIDYSKLTLDDIELD
ncbi:MAG: FHA domain-containing protein [Thermoguttaceae bacterium]|nr:FHA domain-containing protein [Thermoguttaceae bacterium]